MLKIFGGRKTLCDRLSRRDLLHLGGLGMFGLGLDHFFHLREAQASPRDSVWTGQILHSDSLIWFAAAT